jgi:UDP-N-acetylglucosamine:LPS N-acetylglucosamine transferase
MTTVLIVTSAGAGPAAVVPVLAALEVAGVKARAVDIGGAGGGGAGVSDRFRRAILGETAQRKLRREVNAMPPDVALVFDPHAGLAMTVVRDETLLAMPVVAVVSDLAPGPAWAQTDADRFLVVDDYAAFALAQHGVESERIVVVGAFGPYVFSASGQRSPSDIRQTFKLGQRVVLVVIAGMPPEQVGQLLLQLSLLSDTADVLFLFDAGADIDSAAVVRKQVPSLGLRGKLFGASADAPLFWRAAQTIVAKPTIEVISCASLVGVPLLALCETAHHQELGGALQQRGRGITAASTLLLSGALESMLRHPVLTPLPDAASITADAVVTIAAQKREVVEERRGAVAGQVRERVRAVNRAAAVNAGTSTPAGGLEDVSAPTAAVPPVADAPDAAELDNLRKQMRQRLAQLRQAVTSSRVASDRHNNLAQQSRQSSDLSQAELYDRQADLEQTRMHGILSDMAALESELQQLETLKPGPARDQEPAPRANMQSQIDDELSRLKSTTSGGGSAPKSRPAAPAKPAASVDDELAALKKKMASPPVKAKP